MRIPWITSPALLFAFVLTLVWLILVLTAPMMVESGTLTDLSGVVGGHENDDQFVDLPALPRAVYWLGDAECHQLANRSYFINDNQMPFCARDLGLFAGVAAGFGLCAFVRFKVNPVLLILGLVPVGIDGGMQIVTDYESTNTLRLATGVLAGIVLAMLLSQFVFALQEDRKSPKQRPEPPQEAGKPGQG